MSRDLDLPYVYQPEPAAEISEVEYPVPQDLLDYEAERYPDPDRGGGAEQPAETP